MAHPRKLIRHAVVALLAAADTAAADRVQGTRIEPHKKSALPALSVYTLNDPVVEEEGSELEDMHELELEVVGWVAHTEALTADDAMDDLAEAVEAAMNGALDGELAGKATDVRLVGTTMEVIEDNARTDPQVGIVVLTYAVKYRADLAASTGELDEFKRVKADHRIAGAVEANQASDKFTVQETP
jgi:hypothetical protein